MSAFVFGGVPERAVKEAFCECEIWASPQLLREYRSTPVQLLADKKITHIQLRALLSGIASFVIEAKVAIPKRRLSLCRDVADNMILECCLVADADFLITGDRDLLEIDKTWLKVDFPKLKIVSPQMFLEYYG